MSATILCHDNWYNWHSPNVALGEYHLEQTPTDPPAAQPTLTRKKLRVERGIRRDRFGWEAYFRSSGRLVWKRFPPTMSLEAIREWRNDAERKARAMPDAKVLSLTMPALSRSKTLAPSEDGWCYVYFIQDGDGIKIGKALDPWRRLSDLQTAHRNTLTLTLAVPAHADFEQAVQRHFADLATGREWFLADQRLINFIDKLRDGRNPVAVLWEELAKDGGKRARKANAS